MITENILSLILFECASSIKARSTNRKFLYSVYRRLATEQRTVVKYCVKLKHSKSQAHGFIPLTIRACVVLFGKPLLRPILDLR